MKDLTTYIKESYQDLELDPDMISYYMNIWFNRRDAEKEALIMFAKNWNVNGQIKDMDKLKEFYIMNSMDSFTKFCISDMSKNTDYDLLNIFKNIIERIR